MENCKVLGICLAKMQDRIRTEYLSAINRSAAIRGWKTVAFNSFRDFRKNDLSLQGAKSIYDVVNYDDVDVVVVFPESINNSDVADNLIESALAAGKPVISVGPVKKGCYSIVRDYRQGFRDMLDHVINEHNKRDLMFVSGFKTDDERSANMLNVFREVLKENGIDFNDKKVCYGDYKDEVIDECLDKILSGSDIPQGFVCIDDKTAITVCEKLSEYDLKSPDDIVVTGFGGIPAAYYYHPSITTCSDDVEQFAEILIQAAMDAMDGKAPGIYKDEFKARIRRSCGCDMRSYMSAGRRSYDLEAAKAAGLYIPSGAQAGENGGTASGTASGQAGQPGQAGYGTDHLPERAPENERTEDDTVFIPNANAVKLINQRDGSSVESQESSTNHRNDSAEGIQINQHDLDQSKPIGFNVTREFCDDKAISYSNALKGSDPLSDPSTDYAPIVYDRRGAAKPVRFAAAVKRANEVADDKRCAGLHGDKRFRSGNHVAFIYKELDEIERREDSALAWAERMLEITDISDICDEISKRLPSGSELYLYTELLESSFDIETFEEKHHIDKDKKESKLAEELKDLKLTRIRSAKDIHNSQNVIDISRGNPVNHPDDNKTIPVKDIAKAYLDTPFDGKMLVLTPVFIIDFACGYFAVRTEQISDIRSSIKLLNTGLNLIFRFLANQNRQQRMLYNIENSVYVSSMTGLPNLKGSTRWFEGFAAVTENHRKPLSISVFAIPRYAYIYENYGLNEIEDAVRVVVENIRDACRKTSFIGQFAEGEYIVIDIENDVGDIYGEGEAETYGDEIFREFNRTMEAFNRTSTKEYFLEVNYGTATVEVGWDSTLETLVRMAMSDMYLRRLRQGRSVAAIRGRTFDREYFTTFELLVDRNLFRYHYQPIIDAATGKIYGYEALMRTGGGISMSPLDILEIAKNANRLYDVEKATLTNVIRYYVENKEKFGDKKVFINTIPGHFLSKADLYELVEKYGEHLGAFVFEMTESNTVRDEELEELRSINVNGQHPVFAVDDYGTGHSNIVNLLRYRPEIIKLDHYLVSNIQDDSNKQMFVKNTIEFARMNGIKVLAEGVETYEELKKVIEYGIDFIQGFYTAHPSAEIMEKIPEDIRNEILSERIKAAQFDNDNLVYNAKAGETVNLLELALKKYTTVNVLGGKVKLVGEPDNVIDMIVRTADDKKVDLIFENVNLRGALETTVQLGKNSETALTIQGECTLNKDGILVPYGSRLTVSGDGDLHIITSRNLSVGIGSNANEPYGDISFDMTGSVKIVANGDKAVGIGGGRCDGSRIRLINGIFDVSAKAIHAVAIGSSSGDTDIYIGRSTKCRLKSDGNDSVALGTIAGKSEIVCRGKLEIIGDGEKTAGIGSLNGYTKTDLLSNDMQVTLHSYCGIGVGSLTGNADIKLEDAKLDIYAEGTQINGFGSGEEMGNAEINGGSLKVEILAGIPRSFGSQKGDIILNYGSVTSMHDVSGTVLNSHRQKLKPRYIENGIVFEV
ncbi:MAG: EAL domain-containing protein [Lachnospiraceae bacterium]|nr:EAL domain-containing protein [Lachnospiraceae bacterium]